MAPATARVGFAGTRCDHGWRCVMRKGSIALLVVLVALLPAAGRYAYEGLTTAGEPMPTEGYVALIVGAGFAIVIGAGLMALLFYSSRGGYDEAPHYTTPDEDA